MTIPVLNNVMNPEGGIQKAAGGGFGPPGMGGPPGRPPGGPPPGMGRAAPPPPPTSFSSFAKRLDTLENKTVYMVDIGFGGGYNFMLQLQKWFTQNMPSVNTVVKRKPGGVFSDDRSDLWEEVKAKGNAVVLGVAG